MASSSFFQACGNGNDSEVRRQLDCGQAWVNDTDEDGDTGLLWAAQHGHYSTVSLLLSRGANPNIVGAAGAPLWAAVRCPYGADARIVKALIQSGASVNARENSRRNGETALMVAAHQGYADIVDILCRAGASASIADYDGDTAVDYFCYGRQLNTKIATTLLLNGGDINRLYRNGYAFTKQNYGSTVFLQAYQVSQYDLRSGQLTLSYLNEAARNSIW